MNPLQQALLFVTILFSVGLLGILIHHLAPVLTPFIIAAFFAYLIDPWVERLNHKPFKISRSLSVAGMFIIVMIILLLALFFLIPALGHQISMLIAKTPAIIEGLQHNILPKLIAWGLVSEDFGFETLKTTALAHIPQAKQMAEWMGHSLFYSGTVLLSVLMDIFIVFVASFYLLRDWPKILKAVKGLLPSKVAPTVLRLTHQCDVVLSAFIRGQLTVMICLGALYSTGLALVGVNFSLLLGSIAGLLSIVPYLGSIVGMGAALVVAYIQFQAWAPLLWVLLVFGLGHILEGMVLTPWLIGDKLGLHPVAVIFAVLAGGQLLGFTGVILALPVMAILVVLFRELLAYKGIVGGK